MNRKIIKTIFIIIIISLIKTVQAYEKYDFDEYLFYDPVSEKECTYQNFWTIYNTDTTCYRFINITKDDTTSNSTVKAILDHNVALTTYNSYQTALNNAMQKWVKYQGTYDILDETTVYDLLRLTQRPTLENISVNGGAPYLSLTINSIYYFNSKETNTYGFWIKDLYPDDNTYAYTITEYGNNRLTKTNLKRGVRPVVYLDKTKVTKMKPYTDIGSIIKNGTNYNYARSTQNEYTYYDLQGFTVANNKIVFYSPSNTDTGKLFVYSGTNYATKESENLQEAGHGNDLTYNSKTNKYLLVGPNSYKDIFVYNGNTVEYEKTIKFNDISGKKAANIGYDEYNDYYICAANGKVLITNANFKILYSFDSTRTEVGQGLEYHNGYVYAATSELPAETPNSYQIYRKRDGFSNTIYVYNAKFNKDGTPSKDFGKVVDRFLTDTTTGELESVSFYSNKMYLGFYTPASMATNSFQFYAVNYNNVKSDINYKALYQYDKTNKYVKIITNDDLNNNSNIKVKSYTSNNQTVDFCDNYDNCTTHTINDDNNTIIIKNVDPNTTYSTIKNQYTTFGTISDIKNSSGTTLTSNIAKTGDIVSIITSNKTYSCITSVAGDYNKDGLTNMEDAKKIAKYIVDNDNSTLSEEVLAAIDRDENNIIKMNDVMRIINLIN